MLTDKFPVSADSILENEPGYPFRRRCVNVNADVQAMSNSKTAASAGNRTRQSSV